jgi:cellulose 1,4-beta-cellobiosidase
MANRRVTIGVIIVLAITPFVFSQQPGRNTPESHPKLQTHRCTQASGCVPANTSIVLDSNFRWIHDVGGYTNCAIAEEFNQTICPDTKTCAKNCALEGVDYANYGLKTNGDSVSMNLFVQKNNALSLSSPRIYLFDEDAGHYSIFKLINREFTFDVDLSKVGCGVNGALYFSEMSPTGDEDEYNKAGAAYGTGYCDAQCPKGKFVKGRVRCFVSGVYKPSNTNVP